MTAGVMKGVTNAGYSMTTEPVLGKLSSQGDSDHGA